MRDYMKEYISSVDLKLKDNNFKDYKKLSEEYLIKIGFFQHERLIHLIVTLFYVVLFLIFFGLSLINLVFMVIAFILAIFIIFYVVHYFFLENSVQYMYKVYEEIEKRRNVK